MIKFDHVGVVVTQAKFDKLIDIDGLIEIIPHKLNEQEMIVYGLERIEQWGCRCFMIEQTEFIVPDNVPENKLMQWAMRQEQEIGIHHIAYSVDNLVDFMKIYKDKNWISPEPVQGVNGMIVNFIHPTQFGIMLEYVEHKK